MANNKDKNVRDLKAKKDVKGGGPGIKHSNPPFLQGAGPARGQSGAGPAHTQSGGSPRGGAN